jgi:isoamylase
MTDRDWRDGGLMSVGVFLNGQAITEPDPRGEQVRDDSFLLVFNARAEPVSFRLPGPAYAAGWEQVVDTAGRPDAPQLRPGAVVDVPARTSLVLRAEPAGS